MIITFDWIISLSTHETFFDNRAIDKDDWFNETYKMHDINKLVNYGFVEVV